MKIYNTHAVYEKISGKISKWHKKSKIEFSDYAEFSVCLEFVRSQVSGERNPFDMKSALEQFLNCSTSISPQRVLPRQDVTIIYRGPCLKCSEKGQLSEAETACVDDDYYGWRTIETGSTFIYGCDECGGKGSYKATPHWLWGIKKENSGFKKGSGITTIKITITTDGEVRLVK